MVLRRESLEYFLIGVVSLSAWETQAQGEFQPGDLKAEERHDMSVRQQEPRVGNNDQN